MGLAALTKEKMIIQTRLPKHHVFCALAGNDPQIFYKEELKERKELGFPPYRHFGIIKLRGENEPKVKDAARLLFEKLSALTQNKTLKVVSFNPGQPAKLRGNYYWQILLNASSALAITKFIKKNLKNLAHSGIIVTVDIDPL
jgi:primosomal protein N' (replication factor Y)